MKARNWGRGCFQLGEESVDAVAKTARQFGHAMQIQIIIIIHFFRNWFLL